jgi:hypothetical protein
MKLYAKADVEAYIANPRGHVWKLDSQGQVDGFGFETDGHNGPSCAVCGYGFCHHCDDGPDHDCPGVEGVEDERLAALESVIPELIKERDALKQKIAKRTAAVD